MGGKRSGEENSKKEERTEREDTQLCSKDRQWVGHCLGGKWKRMRLREREEKELQKGERQIKRKRESRDRGVVPNARDVVTV